MDDECGVIDKHFPVSVQDVGVDSDDELPFISFTSSKMPSEQKNSEDTNTSEDLSVPCHDDYSAIAAGQSGDLRTSADSAGVVVLDSDSSDDESWRECMFKYSRNLRERCNTNPVTSSVDHSSSPCVESFGLQSGSGSGTASVTDSQPCYSAVADDSPAVWHSSENSQTQTTASDVNTDSQASSIQSDGSGRRRRQQKADDPEAVVCIF